MMAFMWTVVLGCFIAGNSMVLEQKTPSVVRVREGDTLTLEAEVDTDELNLRFTGPGNRVIGIHDHRATGEFQVLKETDTGYLLRVWLTIWPIDRFRSGKYTLTGFDAYSWEQCIWTVIVQVVPIHHVSSVNFSPIRNINDINDEFSCRRYGNDHSMYWEHLECSITVRGAGDIILSQFDQCKDFRNTDDDEKTDLLYEAAKQGDAQLVSMLLMLDTKLKISIIIGVAAWLGHVQIVELLLNSGITLNYEDSYFYSQNTFDSLHKVFPTYLSTLDCAAWSGSVALVDMILEREDELRARKLPVERKGGSLIYFAAMSGSLRLVEKCLSLGEDWNHIDNKGRSPIFFAALSGSVELVKFFEDLGGNLFAKDNYNNSLLFYAARSGSLELVKFLVSTGLPPLEKNSDGATPIFETVLSGSMPMLEAFIKWGGNANFVDYKGRSLLHNAAIMGHVAMVEKLVAIGLNINAVEENYNYFTPLHYAAQFDHPSLVRTIISLGGDIEAVASSGFTPLHIAVLYSNPSCVKQLLSAHANVNSVDMTGKTPLHSIGIRIRYWQYPLQFELIQNVVNEQTEAPFYKTWQSRHRRVIVLLLKAGANPKTVNKWGRTPLHSLAGSNVCKGEYIELLVKAGGDLNAVDENGWTPLHRAALYKKLSCIRKLVKCGASITVVNKNGKTPLDIAKMSEVSETIQQWLWEEIPDWIEEGTVEWLEQEIEEWLEGLET